MLISSTGRYCETLGWVSMSGFTTENSGFNGIFPNPAGVPNPTRKATNTSTAPWVYSRRYLDWNRLTFAYRELLLLFSPLPRLGAYYDQNLVNAETLFPYLFVTPP